jgi:hypothetical protein
MSERAQARVPSAMEMGREDTRNIEGLTQNPERGQRVVGVDMHEAKVCWVGIPEEAPQPKGNSKQFVIGGRREPPNADATFIRGRRNTSSGKYLHVMARSSEGRRQAADVLLDATHSRRETPDDLRDPHV